MELVESWESVASDGTTVYQNYHTKIPKKRTALESFFSAIETVVFWGNHKIFGDFLYSPKEWETVERNTFDRKRTLIFVKN